ncbi:Arc family DNA-binding protein [Zoogloea sp.]|uniref:FitA-like ribbon-helix-helix domain-containing protein n=1 Tax=Zoogloea sp. TaxID=49181 RepID=UPI0035B0977E
MPVTLTIKNVPDKLAEQLRSLAAAHHRSLQGELMAIVEAVARNEDPAKIHAPLPHAMVVSQDRADPKAVSSDDLLDQLDSIVMGSQWGQAPILTRSQAHNRALSREFDYQLQEEQAHYKP